MVTRTIEPIHVVLPDADGGYYRFGALPQLIAEALKPDTEEADADPQGSYYVIRAIDQMDYEKDLPQAAALDPSEPGYLHVVENSASKRPLKWRMGAVLNAGLVHLDWLNEWGESRKPQHVFSTVSAPEPQAATPAPVVAGSASNAPDAQNIPMKKAALIAALEHEWESIESDLSEATRNGLKDAAHAGKHGEWYESKARAWAVSKGKIRQAAPALHPTMWPGTVTRNRL